MLQDANTVLGCCLLLDTNTEWGYCLLQDANTVLGYCLLQDANTARAYCLILQDASAVRGRRMGLPLRVFVASAAGVHPTSGDGDARQHRPGPAPRTCRSREGDDIAEGAMLLPTHAGREDRLCYNSQVSYATLHLHMGSYSPLMRALGLTPMEVAIVLLIRQ